MVNDAHQNDGEYARKHHNGGIGAGGRMQRIGEHHTRNCEAVPNRHGEGWYADHHDSQQPHRRRDEVPITLRG